MTSIQHLVNYFFELKGLDEEEVKEKSKKGEINYPRYVKPARDLLTLADGNLETAKELLAKIAEKADKNGWEEWQIETIFKFYLELI